MKSQMKWIQICIFILLHSVTSLDVKGFIGKSVLLPCSSTSPSKTDVLWRDGNNNVVLDIKDNTENLNYQDKSYKGRVSSFPTEYQKKNYSITLQNLKQEDAGNFECIIVIDGEETTNCITLDVEDGGNPKSSASCVSSRWIVLQTLILSALSLIIYF